MNPLKIFMVVVILIVLLILGTLTQLQPPPTPEPENCHSRCAGDNACIRQCDAVAVNIALRDQVEDPCQQVENKESCNNVVTLKKALDTFDTSACDAIPNSIKRGNCKDNVIYLQAGRNNDPSLCQQINNPETKKLCEQDS